MNLYVRFLLSIWMKQKMNLFYKQDYKIKKFFLVRKN